eukprot:TRINITY_DN1248_c0_g1_i1.p1 TRINITY_DN1248_c0_g1~~TRINITY_DN1248_c0_g1_i1.p1  ORF type:complete len:144 (-),score=3.74 TRINITY_DN1248_c0_g1_i1:36-467(-)
MFMCPNPDIDLTFLAACEQTQFTASTCGPSRNLSYSCSESFPESLLINGSTVIAEYRGEICSGIPYTWNIYYEQCWRNEIKACELVNGDQIVIIRDYADNDPNCLDNPVNQRYEDLNTTCTVVQSTPIFSFIETCTEAFVIPQ